MARLSDGTRKVTGIGEVIGIEDDQVEMQDIFEFERTGISRAAEGAGQLPRQPASSRWPGAAEGYGIHLRSRFSAKSTR